MVRYYGWYSNASRGKRRLAGQAAAASPDYAKDLNPSEIWA